MGFCCAVISAARVVGERLFFASGRQGIKRVGTGQARVRDPGWRSGQGFPVCEGKCQASETPVPTLALSWNTFSVGERGADTRKMERHETEGSCATPSSQHDPFPPT